MHVMWSRWGFQIEGKEVDLDNLRLRLNGAIRSADDPFVSKLSEVFVIRSSRWNDARNYDEVYSLVSREVAILTTCIHLIDGCEQINLGTLFEFLPDEEILRRERRTEISITVRKPISDRAPPEAFSAFYRAAQQEEFGSVLAEFGSAPNWFELYKAMEALERLYGGERALRDRFAENKGAVAKLKQTANSYRHHASKFQPVAAPMSLNDARELTRRLIDEAARDFQGDESAERMDVGVPDHTYVPGTSIAFNRLSLGENEAPEQ